MLVTIPCNDGVSPFSNSSSSVLKKNADNSHPSDGDDCSVFCNCACCAVVMVFEKISLEIKDNPEIHHTSKIPDFQIFILPKILSGIWQPPKLS